MLQLCAIKVVFRVSSIMKQHWTHFHLTYKFYVIVVHAEQQTKLLFFYPEVWKFLSWKIKSVVLTQHFLTSDAVTYNNGCPLLCNIKYSVPLNCACNSNGASIYQQQQKNAFTFSAGAIEALKIAFFKRKFVLLATRQQMFRR